MLQNVKLPKLGEGGMMGCGGNESLQVFHRRWLIHLLVILAYTLLALALTWPLARDFATHVPGNGVDDPPLTWNLWWVQFALLQEGTNPFDCNYLFYRQLTSRNTYGHVLIRPFRLYMKNGGFFHCLLMIVVSFVVIIA